jgi:crotonobetainyl-CoA:carnitine CoA-transferase CaiB-like acyl-CoA transferase
VRSMTDVPSDDRLEAPARGTRLPLSRYKVLDLTHARAGPTCVRHLGDWGAEVIRIEQPAAADSKEEIAGKRSGFDFQNLHRNKQAMTLNLKMPEGKEVFMRLAKSADVIVENMRPDVKRRLGVDYHAVRKVNPRLIYGSISGFGQDGVYGDRAGVDQIAQGMGGLMSITGLPGQGPVRVGIPIADLTAGGFLAQGILVALLDREVTGEGRWVKTSLLEAQIAMLDFQAARWLIKGEVPKQEGNNHPTSIPTGVFPTADGHINIAASGGRIWERLCRTLGAEELLEDPRYRTSDGRSRHRHELNEAIGANTKRKPSGEWIEVLNDAGVPCGPIYSIDEVFADPQVEHLRMALPVEHPELGPLKLVAQPYTISGCPRELRTATPRLGEHTEAILQQLGYDEGEIALLREKGAI